MKLLDTRPGADVMIVSAAATLPFPPTSVGQVQDWNGTHGAVPEFDLEVWALAASNLTLGELLGGVLHPHVVVDQVVTATFGTDILTSVAHGLLTGDGPLFISNVGGAIPAGLAAGVKLYAIKATDDTYRVASSRELALAGAYLDITDNGSGTNTISDSVDTARVYWHGYGLIGYATDGAVTLAPGRAYTCRVSHKTTTIAYAFVGTPSASVVSARIIPVRDQS